MLFTDEDPAGEVQIGPAQHTASETATDSRRHAAEATAPPPIFHPLAYRGVVAGWPVEWREQWGLRANELEDSGLPWRDAETQAFVEVWKLRRQVQPPQTPTETLAASRN